MYGEVKNGEANGKEMDYEMGAGFTTNVMVLGSLCSYSF